MEIVNLNLKPIIVVKALLTFWSVSYVYRADGLIWLISHLIRLNQKSVSNVLSIGKNMCKKTQTCIVLLKKDANGTVLVLAAAEGH